MVVLKVKRLDPNIEPKYSHPGDAGLDLQSSGRYVIDLDSEKREIESEEYEIGPGERIMVKTGLHIEIPKGCWGSLRDRSGLAVKHGLHVLGGVADNCYRGEVGVILVNLSKNSYKIKKYERIAQMVVQTFENVSVEFVEELSDTERGEGGLGHTGTH